MKKLIYFTLLTLMSSCNRSCDPETDYSVIATKLVTPTKSQLCTTLPIEFRWESVANANSYILNISKVENGKETQIINQTLSATSFSTSNLEKGKLYLWNVESIGPKNRVKTENWQFQTESNAISNYAPYLPELVFPLSSTSYSLSTNIKFQWKCTDPDNDALNYDVYLGTDMSNLKLIKSSLKDPFCNFDNLIINNNYYWQVVAIDSNLNKTYGQIWKFSTSN